MKTKPRLTHEEMAALAMKADNYEMDRNYPRNAKGTFNGLEILISWGFNLFKKPKQIIKGFITIRYEDEYLVSTERDTKNPAVVEAVKYAYGIAKTKEDSTFSKGLKKVHKIMGLIDEPEPSQANDKYVPDYII